MLEYGTLCYSIGAHALRVCSKVQYGVEQKNYGCTNEDILWFLKLDYNQKVIENREHKNVAEKGNEFREVYFLDFPEKVLLVRSYKYILCYFIGM